MVDYYADRSVLINGMSAKQPAVGSARLPVRQEGFMEPAFSASHTTVTLGWESGAASCARAQNGG
jgi:hypothetical protein